MKRTSYLVYGLLSYCVLLGTLVFSIAFFGNLWVARTIDGAALVPVRDALPLNAGLLLLFGLQHSGMASQPFKRWLQSRLHSCLGRSTYILVSSLVLILMMLLWQPMGGVVWSVSNDVLSRTIHGIYFFGWATMIYATFLLDHLDMVGLRQAYTAYRGGECKPQSFRAPGLYRHVRHPVCLGWLMVLWAAPVMTVSHLVFAAGMTIYTLIGIQFEERSLTVELDEYEQYRRKVPMLLPSLRKRLVDDAENGRAQSV